MISLLWFLIMSAEMIKARVGIMVCSENDDCIEGYSCLNNICMKCLKCALFLRRGSDCVTSINDCGECLVGFEEVLITDSSKALKPCKPVRLKKKLKEQKCDYDFDCPPGNFCHEGSCVGCYNCNLMNRFSPVEGCAKGLNECGSCTNGFTEVPVTRQSNSKRCERQEATVVTDIYKTYIDVILIASLLFVMVLAATLLRFSKRNTKTIAEKPRSVIKRSLSPKLPSAPPLQITDIPRDAILKLEDKEFNVPLTAELRQQAVVFKQPDAFYYYKEEEMRESDPDSEDNLEENVEDFIQNLPASTTSTQSQAVMECLRRSNHTMPSGSASVTNPPPELDETDMNPTHDEVCNQQETEVPVESTVDASPDTNALKREKKS